MTDMQTQAARCSIEGMSDNSQKVLKQGERDSQRMLMLDEGN